MRPSSSSSNILFRIKNKRKKEISAYDDMAIEMSAQFKKQQEKETKGHALMYS